MPRIELVEIDAFLHCSDALCDGYAQQPVRAYHETVSVTYADGGADPNLIDTTRVEHSTSRLRLVDETDAPCPHCANPRELTDQVRPKYRNLSGQDPEFLKKQLARDRARERGLDVSYDNASYDKPDRVAELERQVAKLTEALAAKKPRTAA